MIPILILAAGQSTRMRGADKLLERVDDRPLLRKQAQIARGTGQPVFIALGPSQTLRAGVVADLDVTVLIIADAAQGLSYTLRGAVAQLPQVAGFMVLLADLVALQTSDLSAVLDARIAHPDHLIWRGTTADGKAGHPILFDAALRPEFAGLEGDNGGETIIRRHADRTFLVPLPDDRARRDLDTPQDWAAWRAARTR